jgi:hypothetical protein
MHKDNRAKQNSAGFSLREFSTWSSFKRWPRAGNYITLGVAVAPASKVVGKKKEKEDENEDLHCVPILIIHPPTALPG